LDRMEYVLIFLYKKVNHNYLKLFERREQAGRHRGRALTQAGRSRRTPRI